MKEYRLDSRRSKINWYHEDDDLAKGEFDFAEGKFSVELGTITKGFLTIDLSSFKLDSNTPHSNEERERITNHLKSDAFLNVAQKPEATFQIDGIGSVRNRKTFEGLLFFNGNTLNLSIPAILHIRDDKIIGTGEFDFTVLADVAMNGSADLDLSKIQINFHISAFPA